MAKRGYVDPEINHPHKGAPLIIGRDPGYEEASQGKPFVGKAGRLVMGGFDAMTGEHLQGSISHAGLTREDCNITYRVLKSSWNGDFFRHSWEDIKEGERELEKLIKELEPSFILATGAHAAYDLVPSWPTLTDRRPGAMSGGRSIKAAKEAMDRRGFMWMPEESGLPCPIMPTLDPMIAVYSPVPERVLLDIDFQRMGAHMRGELPRQYFPDFHIIRTEADMAPIWDSELVSYDIEIKWGGEAFLCIAFYTLEGYAGLAYADGLRACEPWLRSDRVKLAHNSQFDRYFLEAKMGIPVGGRHEDTICGHWSCYPELAGKAETGREDQKKKVKSQMTRKGLNFLASFHLNYPWWKTYTSSPDLMGRLCVNDVVATLDIHRVIDKDIEHFGVRRQYERQLAKLPALIAVQRRGFLVDESLRKERVRALKGRQVALADSATHIALTYLQDHKITHDAKGKEYWWYHSAQCECCNGAKICKKCNKLKDMKKPTLILWCLRAGMALEEAKLLKVAEIKDLLHGCSTCEGTGKVDKWDFNIMSPTQLPSLLWDHLDVPKGCAKKGEPSADEETIKKVLEWSKT